MSILKDDKGMPLDAEKPGSEELEVIAETGIPPVVDEETEKRLLKKLDRRIIPCICWIYLMNFMDRGRHYSTLSFTSG